MIAVDYATVKSSLAPVPNHTVFDGEPPETPPNRYFCLYDSAHFAFPTRYVGVSTKTSGQLRVVCAGRTPAGVRASVRAARDALTDLPLSYGLLRETQEGFGPLIFDGPVTDRRVSMTLTYRAHNQRRTV